MTLGPVEPRPSAGGTCRLAPSTELPAWPRAQAEARAGLTELQGPPCTEPVLRPNQPSSTSQKLTVLSQPGWGTDKGA